VFIGAVGGAILACGLVGGLLLTWPVSQYATIRHWCPHGAAGPIYVRRGAGAVLVVDPRGWALFVGLTSHFSTDFQREWYARAGAWMCIAIVVWLALVGISVLGPAALLSICGPRTTELSLSLSSIGAGSIAVLGGTPGRCDRRERQGAQLHSSAAKALFARLPSLAAPVFSGRTALDAGAAAPRCWSGTRPTFTRARTTSTRFTC
jgi:hypothetical protein